MDGAGMSLVVYAKDVPRVSAFYAAVLGVSAEHPDPTYAVLDGDHWQLVVQAIPPAYADEITIGDPPELREDTPVKPVFPVSRIAAAREQAAAHGGGIAAPDREWTFRRSLRCDGFDPEGNVLQLSQPVP